MTVGLGADLSVLIRLTNLPGIWINNLWKNGESGRVLFCQRVLSIGYKPAVSRRKYHNQYLPTNCWYSSSTRRYGLYRFEVIARDRATASLEDKGDQVHEAKVNITLFILDINDNAPTFYGYTRLRRKEEQRRPGTGLISNIVPIYLTEVTSTLR